MNTKEVVYMTAAVMGIVASYYAITSAKRAASNAIDAINPTNNDNIFSNAVDGVGATITGDKNWNLGSALYDLFN